MGSPNKIKKVGYDNPGFKMQNENLASGAKYGTPIQMNYDSPAKGLGDIIKSAKGMVGIGGDDEDTTPKTNEMKTDAFSGKDKDNSPNKVNPMAIQAIAGAAGGGGGGEEEGGAGKKSDVIPVVAKTVMKGIKNKNEAEDERDRSKGQMLHQTFSRRFS